MQYADKGGLEEGWKNGGEGAAYWSIWSVSSLLMKKSCSAIGLSGRWIRFGSRRTRPEKRYL